MKNTFIYKVLLAVIALITVSACDDREIVQVENGNSPIIIDLSATDNEKSRTFQKILRHLPAFLFSIRIVLTDDSGESEHRA